MHVEDVSGTGARLKSSVEDVSATRPMMDLDCLNSAAACVHLTDETVRMDVVQDIQRDSIVGLPRVWAREFAFMGFIGGIIVYGPMWFFRYPLGPIQTSYDIIGTSLTHGLLAALLGGMLSGLLERMRGRVGFPGIWAVVLFLSGLWGGISVIICRLYFFSLGGMPEVFTMGERIHFLALGSGGVVTGLAVFGPLWLFYTMASVLRWRHRWLVVLASVVTALVAYPLFHGVVDLIQG